MNSNWNDMMEANAHAGRPGAKLGAKLKHIEIVHHMSDGKEMAHSFAAHEGKEMGEHMASCPHCSGMMGAVEGDGESAAGAAT